MTFDCYGTLINWEAGILSALKAALQGLAGVDILERFASLETEAEKTPYLPYRQVLKRVQAGLGLRSRRSFWPSRSRAGSRSRTPGQLHQPGRA